MKMGRKPVGTTVDDVMIDGDRAVTTADYVGLSLNERVVTARDAIVVSGPEAVKWLQGQLSQDVLALATGQCAWSWILNPSGKVDALVRVTRIDDDSLVLDVEAGYIDAVVTRLNRFKLRTKADINPVSCVVTSWLNGGESVTAAAEAATYVHRYEHHQMRRTDMISTSPIDAPHDVDRVNVDRDSEASGNDTQWRIDARWPAMGRELTDATIPAETGLIDATVSFTKGCYTGQELTARLDSRGSNVPRHLRRIVSVDPTITLSVGVELTDATGKKVGQLTTALAHRALAYVARSVDVGVVVRCGEVDVTVEA
jgi:tRNA-modifying protein YgfZ